MNRKLIIIFSVLVVLLATAYLVWHYVFEPAEISVASRPADVKTEVFKVLTDFEIDEQSANEKYLGKILVVSGPVGSIKADSAGVSVYLTENGISGVLCGFNAKAIDTSLIRVGDKVSVKGYCTGYLLDVIMNKCVMVAE